MCLSGVEHRLLKKKKKNTESSQIFCPGSFCSSWSGKGIKLLNMKNPTLYPSLVQGPHGAVGYVGLPLSIQNCPKTGSLAGEFD